MISGFNAYCLYLGVKKMHFNNSKFDASTLKKNPFKDKLLNNWNKERSSKDGALFQEINTKFNNTQTLVLLYASYYIKDKDFYVRHIIDERYETFKKNIYEIQNIDKIFTTDLKSVIIYSKENKLKIKDLFISTNSIPKIFKMKISYNSLVILEKVFNIIELNKDIKMNLIEERRWKDEICTLKQYTKIVDKHFKDVNWKELTKNYLTEMSCS
jgi:hypothetical protein